MPDLALNDIVEMKIYCKSEAQISQNVLHYKVISKTGAVQTSLAAATVFSGNVQARMKACLCEEALYLGVTCQVIAPTRRPASLFNGDEGLGAFAGEQIPRQVSGLIKKLTNSAGKHGRGRVYVPFPSEAANLIDGTPDVAYVSFLAALATELSADVVVGAGGDITTLRPILWDRENSVDLPIVEWVPRSVWATQRRRGDTRHGDLSPF